MDGQDENLGQGTLSVTEEEDERTKEILVSNIGYTALYYSPALSYLQGDSCMLVFLLPRLPMADIRKSLELQSGRSCWAPRL